MAKEAGVAISTVSNALNNSDLVNDETKKRILEVADRLHYVPNLTGRQLKARKSHMLGFLTSSIRGDYFTVLLEAMSSQCTDLGYRVPEDISVSGFDDINIAQYFTPKLSTFKNPIDLQGITAAKMLVNMIEHDQEGKTEYLRGKLIIRDSTSIVLDRKLPR